MDHADIIRVIILEEISQPIFDIYPVLNSLVLNNSTNLLLFELEKKEPDVYVNNYFEEVVPRYSNATYKTHFRMTRATMELLIEKLRNVFIAAKVDVNKMTISLEKKTHVTLWMLANYAVTFRECGTLFGMSTGNVHFIFMQICTAISLLRGKYIQWPNAQKCDEMAENTASFPGVIGALDGCHIEIKAPSTDNAYDYYNRKQFYSVILQGVCDTSLRFIDIFVGLPGKVHDARVFRLSPLNKYINEGLIPRHLHLLADSAYALHENVLTPYRDNGHLSRQQKTYNRKHSAVRSCIERAFGLLKNKFRRLRFLDMSILEEIPTVITAACILHNFILLTEGFEEGEDFVDNIDEVPDIEGHDHVNCRNGNIKRNYIAHLL